MRETAVAVAVMVLMSAGCREEKTAPPRVTVFVAASMTEVVEELAEAYGAASGVDVEVSPAASGVLRKQIESGAACDVFLSADTADMDKLAQQGLIRADTRREVACNHLVVVACDQQSRDWSGLAALAGEDVGRVALGDPAYVPAGRYARRALEAAGVWSAVEPRAVLGDNVRVVGQYVRSRQADVGLVYATDAALMDGCRVVLAVDAELTGPIVCPGAVCARAHEAAHASAFLEFLTAPAQRAVWERRGFRPPGSADGP